MSANARSSVSNARSVRQRGDYANAVSRRPVTLDQNVMESQVVDSSAEEPWAELCRGLQRPAMLLAYADEAV
jgi:hypothetical protein